MHSSAKWIDYFAGKEAERLATEKARKAEAEQERRMQARRTDPGMGLTPFEVETITWHYAVKPKTVLETWLLLKDGSAYFNPKIPPSDFDVAISRSIEPENWYRWKQGADKTYYYAKADSDTWTPVPGKSIDSFSAKSLNYRGENTRSWQVNGVGGGKRTTSIQLDNSGRFATAMSETRRSSGNGMFVVVETTQDASGEVSSTYSSSEPLLANNKTRTNEFGADRSGRYLISGYTIEFRADSGKVTRQIVLQPWKDGMVVDGTYYFKPK